MPCATAESLPFVQAFMLRGRMYLLFLDEFGHEGAYDEGAGSRHMHHPLFGLAGCCVPGQHLRNLDRGFLRLKQRYFAPELAQAAQRGQRAEQWECKSLRIGDRTHAGFARDVLSLIGQAQGWVQAIGRVKHAGVLDHDSRALYTTVVQESMWVFEQALRKAAAVPDGTGVIIMDRRSEGKDNNVLASSKSYYFCPPAGRAFERLVEGPMLVPSEYYHGVQVADVVARVVGSVYRWRRQKEPGH